MTDKMHVAKQLQRETYSWICWALGNGRCHRRNVERWLFCVLYMRWDKRALLLSLYPKVRHGSALTKSL